MESGLAQRMHFTRSFPEVTVPELPALQFAFIDASHLFDLSVLDFVQARHARRADDEQRGPRAHIAGDEQPQTGRSRARLLAGQAAC